MKRSYINLILSNVLFLTLIIACFTSCKKFVEVSAPPNQLINADVFSNKETINSALAGVYSKMIDDDGFASGGSASITALCGLSSDDLSNYAVSNDYAQFYNNNLLPNNSLLTNSLWGSAYSTIFTANSIIEGVQNSSAITAQEKDQYTGEAEFIRAFCHFYIVNLWGDVPLVLSTDYKQNQTISRTSKDLVYKQIITDLISAASALPADYSAYGNERVRPTKWAALALLARCYLFTGDYANAEKVSTDIIDNPLFSLPEDLNSVFLANSPEAIWQLKPNKPGVGTNEAQAFIFTTVPTATALTTSLVGAFEAGDKRKANWVDSIIINGDIYYYPYKYKINSVGLPLTEYSMVFRLAEQYLIRSEARAQQDKIEQSREDLNAIRNRAGLANTTADNKTSLLDAIQQERRVELFTEWGHRWLDLCRWKIAPQVLSVNKGFTVSNNAALYPIPQSERNNDPNLSQNPGY